MGLGAVPPLTVQDLNEVLERMGPELERVVLIGGQAVECWVQYYLRQGRAPELAATPVASLDIDFCASVRTVVAIADRLQGKPIFPGGKIVLDGFADAVPLAGTPILPGLRSRTDGFDDATPNAAVVRFFDARGHERTIDFLPDPHGMDAAEVERGSISVGIDRADGTETGLACRVMHPVHCMESRVHNVIGLPDRYDTPHGRRQLRASVVLAREALKDTLEATPEDGSSPVRRVLRLNERIFRFCLEDDDGRVIHAHPDGADPLDAVLLDPRLGEGFLTKRWPQVKAQIEGQRRRLADHHKRAAEIRARAKEGAST